MRAHFLLLLTALLAIGSPALAAFTVSVDAPEEMFAGDTASVTITIQNSGAETFFSASQILAAPPANTWASVEGASAIGVPMGGTGMIKVKLTPSIDAKPTSYSFTITISEQGTSESREGSWSTTMRQRVAAGLIREFNLTCTSCTGNKIGVTAVVENIGTAPLTAVKLPVNVAGKELALDVGDLPLGGKKTLSGELDLSGLKPGDYQAKAQLTSGDTNLDARAMSFIIPVLKDLQTGRGESFTPWSKTIQLTATNKGNSPDQARLTASVTPSAWVSISYSQPPTSQSGDEVAWVAGLEPGQSLTVSYTEFYWPIPIIIIAIVLGVIYGYLWTTAVTLDKKVTKREGQWAVSLTITNKGQAVDGVVVRDVVPAGMGLGGHFETIKPIGHKMESGIELLWRVGGMRKGEQRVLHYRMTGDHGARLPPARLRAKRGEKTLLVSSSEVGVPGSGAPPKLKVEVKK